MRFIFQPHWESYFNCYNSSSRAAAANKQREIQQNQNVGSVCMASNCRQFLVSANFVDTFLVVHKWKIVSQIALYHSVHRFYLFLCSSCWINLSLWKKHFNHNTPNYLTPQILFAFKCNDSNHVQFTMSPNLHYHS